MKYIKLYEGHRTPYTGHFSIDDIKVGDYYKYQDKTIDERDEILEYVVKITKLYKDDDDFDKDRYRYHDIVQFKAICLWPEDLRGFYIKSNDRTVYLYPANPKDIEEYNILYAEHLMKKTASKYNL